METLCRPRLTVGKCEGMTNHTPMERCPGREIRDVYGNLVSPAMLLAAYRSRCFPMAEHRYGRIDWFRPHRRAIITWDQFKLPRSLRKTWRKKPYQLSLNRDFSSVIAACAERGDTWISEDVEQLYRQLHGLGVAHSCEAWDAEGRLVGGLYGLVIGGCFCGESMFHRANDAAKLCVLFLIHLLRRHGFSLLDCQQQTPHMQRLGAYEVSDQSYAGLFGACCDDACVLIHTDSSIEGWYG
jgi:leucyl/phenylalanyl-tRNA---protein transferase